MQDSRRDDFGCILKIALYGDVLKNKRPADHFGHRTPDEALRSLMSDHIDAARKNT